MGFTLRKTYNYTRGRIISEEIYDTNELVKDCPFCGGNLILVKDTVIRKDGSHGVEMRYTHDFDLKYDCVLDKIKNGFYIEAGDANIENNYIGEYAKEWNDRK